MPNKDAAIVLSDVTKFLLASRQGGGAHTQRRHHQRNAGEFVALIGGER